MTENINVSDRSVDIIHSLSGKVSVVGIFLLVSFIMQLIFFVRREVDGRRTGTNISGNGCQDIIKSWACFYSLETSNFAQSDLVEDFWRQGLVYHPDSLTFEIWLHFQMLKVPLWIRAWNRLEEQMNVYRQEEAFDKMKYLAVEGSLNVLMLLSPVDFVTTKETFS